MTIKHVLSDLEESPRLQKRSSPPISPPSRSSSPLFSAKATSPAMPDDPFTSLDPALLPTHDALNNNYTTADVGITPATLEEMERMAVVQESVEEHIASMTPVKSTVQTAPDADMMKFSPAPTEFSFISENGLVTAEALGRMPEQERWELYKRNFESLVMDIHEVVAPAACEEFPDFADEILEAYTCYITVVVKIWTNYDSVEQGFYIVDYNDDIHAERLKDCGKIYLPHKQRRRLERLDRSLYQFSNVRLYVGTPFRTLMETTLQCRDHGPKWGLHLLNSRMVEEYNTPHNVLMHLLKGALSNIKKDGVGRCQTGFTFYDLQNIAKEFMFTPENMGQLGQWFTDW